MPNVKMGGLGWYFSAAPMMSRHLLASTCSAGGDQSSRGPNGSVQVPPCGGMENSCCSGRREWTCVRNFRAIRAGWRGHVRTVASRQGDMSPMSAEQLAHREIILPAISGAADIRESRYSPSYRREKTRTARSKNFRRPFAQFGYYRRSVQQSISQVRS